MVEYVYERCETETVFQNGIRSTTTTSKSELLTKPSNDCLQGGAYYMVDGSKSM